MAGSLVLAALRSKNTDYKQRTDDKLPLVSAQTDFPVYDFMNAEIGAIIGPGGNIHNFLNDGMSPGVHSFIGKSQSGKTSLALKLSGNIVQKYPNSVLYFRDAEHTTSSARIYSLTGMNAEVFSSKVDYVRYGINHDFVFNDIRNICQAKESLKNDIMIDTGMKDMNGKPIRIYPPDVYLIDSLPSLNPTDDDAFKTGDKVKDLFELKDERVNNNIEGMRIAGSNKLLIVKVLDMLYKYNIRLILINHITANTEVGVSNPRYISKQMIYLKQNEKLPGGAAYLYQCTSIIRTDFSSRLEEGEFGPNISGSRNKLTMTKNKNNISGVPVEIIFDQRTGYNALLSSFNYIYNRGYGFEGNPRSMYLKAYPQVTFTKKNLWGKLVEDYRTDPDNHPFVSALVATSKRCLYYDFVLGKPDPNPENWTNSNPYYMDNKVGVIS